MKHFLLACAIAMLAIGVGGVVGAAESPSDPLVVVVMDPLAAPLSCPCVEGYAQRDYEALAERLETLLARPIALHFSESLERAMKLDTKGRADLVIGKRSVIEADAKKTRWKHHPIAALTGKDGAVTQTGIFVVPAEDPAQSIADLKGYRIIFGPSESDEKHAAALAALAKRGIKPPKQLEIASGCSDGAKKILAAGPSGRSAAVISSYAKPLLSGCGVVKKGELRAVGTTDRVPFVVACVSDALPIDQRQAIAKALTQARSDPQLMIAMESLLGFVPLERPDDVAKKK